jgi:hypothetical protein
MDKTTARVRSYLIIIAILQLACLGASFSDDNAVGGKCTDERVIPYLMDIMLLLQVLAHVLLGVEYFCGYGTINLEEAKRKDEKFEIVKKRASADVKFFQSMTSFMFRWSLVMVAAKMGLVILDRNWVT